jgi:hypothetical protein
MTKWLEKTDISECLTFSTAKPMKLTETMTLIRTTHFRVHKSSRPRVPFSGYTRIVECHSHKNSVVIKKKGRLRAATVSGATVRAPSFFDTDCFCCFPSVESNTSSF